VYSSPINLESIAQLPSLNCASDESRWYAVHTMARHEKRIAAQLEEKSVCTFLPLLRQIHKWSDRRSTVEVPMFSCYSFVRIAQTTEERLKVLRTPGVLGFVGSERQGTPIPDEQIESLQTALREKIPCAVHPFIRIGQRVRVRGGSLNGIEGILVGQSGDQTLVITVELLQRSVAIRVAGYDIELVS
jgi:transcription antitermination factor NusG